MLSVLENASYAVEKHMDLAAWDSVFRMINLLWSTCHLKPVFLVAVLSDGLVLR